MKVPFVGFEELLRCEELQLTGKGSLRGRVGSCCSLRCMQGMGPRAAAPGQLCLKGGRCTPTTTAAQLGPSCFWTPCSLACSPSGQLAWFCPSAAGLPSGCPQNRGRVQTGAGSLMLP